MKRQCIYKISRNVIFFSCLPKSCIFFQSNALFINIKTFYFFVGAIKRKVELEWGTEDTEYLQKVHTHVEGALNELKPDIIVYNAGTDILDGDPLGGLAISPQGIVKRDEVVFKAARSRRIPILMVTSGGYQKRTARIIADSILNLHNLGLIDKELATSGAENPKVEQMIRDSAKDLTNLSLQ